MTGNNSEIVAHNYTANTYAKAGNYTEFLNSYWTALGHGYLGSYPSVYSLSNFEQLMHFRFNW